MDPAWNLFATPTVGISPWKLESLYHEDDERHLDTISTGSASSGLSAMSWESALSCSVVVKKEPLDDYEDMDLSCYDMEMLLPLVRETKRSKRKSSAHDSNNNQSCHSNLNAKAEPRRSRQGRILKQHNQARNTSSSSHSDSSSSTHSSCSTKPATSYQPERSSKVQHVLLGDTAALVRPKTESTSEGSCSDSSEVLPILTPPSSPESIRNVGTSDAELALLGHQGIIRLSSANGNIPRSALARLTAAKNLTRSTHNSRILNVNQGLPTAAVTQRNISASQASTSKDI